MKKKLVNNTEPVRPPDSPGWWITVQLLEDILVLNIYKDRILKARHCINVNTHEFATARGNTWTAEGLEAVLGTGNYWYTDRNVLYERFRLSGADERMIAGQIQRKRAYDETAFGLIKTAEYYYREDKRERAEERRRERIEALMKKVPPLPAGIKEWVDQRVSGGMDFCIKDRKTGKWTCSSCGRQSDIRDITGADGTKDFKNNDMVICPECKKEIKYLSRNQAVRIKTYFTLAEPLDSEMAVMRHFRADIECEDRKKQIGITEEIRIILHKHQEDKSCSIYYEQETFGGWCREGEVNIRSRFDNQRNPKNKREHAGYLYDGGIMEAFGDTEYENMGRLFAQMAAAGIKADYNNLMVIGQKESFMKLAEMLFRGRFYRLLLEASKKCWISYYGILNTDGSSMEEVFGIQDRQKINRIRDRDGGELMVEWMRWSERNRQKISDRALTWVTDNGLRPEDMAWIKCRFSIEQAMNYIERQKKESYKKKTAKMVIGQYEDYMNMCNRLHKDTTDEMIYRPRELKRRHDEAVEEIQRREAEIRAEEYSEKYSEAEAVLQEIREKYEYRGKKYLIMVPGKIVDIVEEGRKLHHCAASSDRYFDRIKQQETYICFLRKVEQPDEPFYTIEVEPGGTIRQHRGMFDEEPDIGKVKPFLREWQKEIRKRMEKEDHVLAEESRKKREENMEELKRKNNTRVLEGLMEDFMEAI